MPLHGKIVIIKKSGQDGSIFPLMTKKCKIGRGLDNDIRIELPSVSRVHCCLSVKTDGQVVVKSLSDSSAPTLVDSMQITKPTVLKDKSIITVSKRSFRFEYPPDSSYRLSLSPKDGKFRDKRDTEVTRRQLRDSNSSLHSSTSPKSPGIKNATPSKEGSARKRKSFLKENSIQPTRRTRVSFGPDLSPECFDASLPPATPVRRGSLPAHRSSNSSHVDSPTPAVLSVRTARHNQMRRLAAKQTEPILEKSLNESTPGKRSSSSPSSSSSKSIAKASPKRKKSAKGKLLPPSSIRLRSLRRRGNSEPSYVHKKVLGTKRSKSMSTPVSFKKSKRKRRISLYGMSNANKTLTDKPSESSSSDSEPSRKRASLNLRSGSSSTPMSHSRKRGVNILVPVFWGPTTLSTPRGSRSREQTPAKSPSSRTSSPQLAVHLHRISLDAKDENSPSVPKIPAPTLPDGKKSAALLSIHASHLRSSASKESITGSQRKKQQSGHKKLWSEVFKQGLAKGVNKSVVPRVYNKNFKPTKKAKMQLLRKAALRSVEKIQKSITSTGHANSPADIVIRKGSHSFMSPICATRNIQLRHRPMAVAKRKNKRRAETKQEELSKFLDTTPVAFSPLLLESSQGASPHSLDTTRSGQKRRTTSVTPQKRRREAENQRHEPDLSLSKTPDISQEHFISPMQTPSQASSAKKSWVLDFVNNQRGQRSTPSNRDTAKLRRSAHLLRERNSSVKKNTSPSQKVSPASEHSFRGLKKLFRVTNGSPKANYNNVEGIKKLFRSTRSPKSDYTNVCGMKELFSNQEHCDYTSVRGIKQLLRTPKSPKCDFRNVSGVKQLFGKNSPDPDYVDPEVLRKLFDAPPTPVPIHHLSTKSGNQVAKITAETGNTGFSSGAGTMHLLEKTLPATPVAHRNRRKQTSTSPYNQVTVPVQPLHTSPLPSPTNSSKKGANAIVTPNMPRGSPFEKGSAQNRKASPQTSTSASMRTLRKRKGAPSEDEEAVAVIGGARATRSQKMNSLKTKPDKVARMVDEDTEKASSETNEKSPKGTKNKRWKKDASPESPNSKGVRAIHPRLKEIKNDVPSGSPRQTRSKKVEDGASYRTTVANSGEAQGVSRSGTPRRTRSRKAKLDDASEEQMSNNKAAAIKNASHLVVELETPKGKRSRKARVKDSSLQKSPAGSKKSGDAISVGSLLATEFETPSPKGRKPKANSASTKSSPSVVQSSSPRQTLHGRMTRGRKKNNLATTETEEDNNKLQIETRGRRKKNTSSESAKKKGGHAIHPRIKETASDLPSPSDLARSRSPRQTRGKRAGRDATEAEGMPQSGTPRRTRTRKASANASPMVVQLTPPKGRRGIKPNLEKAIEQLEALINETLSDGAGTPVAHLLTPRQGRKRRVSGPLLQKTPDNNKKSTNATPSGSRSGTPKTQTPKGRRVRKPKTDSASVQQATESSPSVVSSSRQTRGRRRKGDSTLVKEDFTDTLISVSPKAKGNNTRVLRSRAKGKKPF